MEPHKNKSNLAGKIGKKIKPILYNRNGYIARSKILGIYASYDENGNKQMNVNLILQKMQANLDMPRARNLTLFGRVLTIKSLALS